MAAVPDVRPPLGQWALRLQRGFNDLPSKTGQCRTPQEVCNAAVVVLEALRVAAVPAPDLELEMLALDYLDRLLLLYRECPQDRGRANLLHARADRAGRRLETAINRQLGGAPRQAGRTR